MRLLDTKTLRLSEFFDEHIPTYAILSHTWDRDEVTYQHIQSLELARSMHGFAKVEGVCQLAASEGYDFIWIDTCCIDKSSSAELSEAINSMYAWYQKSAVCYAHLAGVEYRDPAGRSTLWAFDTDRFKECRWFTRGWTLQELIAPSQVVFYSQDWRHLGTKTALRGLLSEITGIDISILAGGDHQSICVARKMFWASGRQTTRTEDMAYCLMGIFSVNMPLIYGEGKKAFIRLQEEIIKNHDDQSIFAWTIPEEDGSPHQLYGLLADSPRAFSETGRWVAPFPRKHPGRHLTRVTNNGLDTELLLQPQRFWVGLIEDSKLRHMPRNFYKKYHLAVLDCQFGTSGDSWPCIDVVALGSDNGSDNRTEYQPFARVNPWVVEHKSLKSSVTSSRFRNGLGRGWSNALPDFRIFESWGLQLEAFCRSSIPWDFQKISVANKPKQILPFGFRLEIRDLGIDPVDGHPASQWFNHDKLFQRGYLSNGGSRGKHAHLSVKTKTLEKVKIDGTQYEGTKEITSVADGMIQLAIMHPLERATAALIGDDSDSPIVDFVSKLTINPLKEFAKVQYVGLVLGVEFTYRPSERDWVREPWCRLVRLDTFASAEDFQYGIDEKESEESELTTSSGKLVARVDRLDSNGLYNVKLGFVDTSSQILSQPRMRPGGRMWQNPDITTVILTIQQPDCMDHHRHPRHPP